MTGTYRIADLNIGITSLHEGVHRLCAAYSSPDPEPNLAVTTSQADIDFELEKSRREAALEGIPAPRCSDAYLETLAVYRQIAERLPAYDTVLFHGSCVAVDGVGYLFTAKSGTGKSTHTRLWRELLGDRAVMINDDKPLIRIADDGAVIYGTPWDGKHRLSTNASVPLRAICILERSEANRIEPINTREAYPMLLQQVYRPADAEAMRKTLTLIDRLGRTVRLWRLNCNMDIESARLAYDTINEGKT